MKREGSPEHKRKDQVIEADHQLAMAHQLCRLDQLGQFPTRIKHARLHGRSVPHTSILPSMETTCSVVRGIGAYKFGFVNFLLDKLGDPLMLMMQPGVFYLRCCHAGDIAKSPRQGS